MTIILTEKARLVMAETPMNTNVNINPGKKTSNQNQKIIVNKSNGEILKCIHCEYDGRNGFLVVNNDAAKTYRLLNCPNCKNNMTADQNIYCTKEEYESGSKGKNYSNPNYSPTDNTKQGSINNIPNSGHQRADKEIMRSQNDKKIIMTKKAREIKAFYDSDYNQKPFNFKKTDKETSPETLEYQPAKDFENASRYNPINKIKDTNLYGRDDPEDGEIWGGCWDRRYRDRDYEKHIDWTINKVDHYYPGWLEDYIKKIGGKVYSTPIDSHVMNLQEGQIRKEPVYPEIVTEKLLQDRHKYNEDYKYTKANNVIITKTAEKIIDEGTVFYNGKKYICVTQNAQKTIKETLKENNGK